MNGGGEKNIEPGFKVMKDQVNPNVLAYEPSPGKMTELFQSGQAVIAVWGTGRVQAFANTGFPVDFVYPKEGAAILLASACPVAKANASPAGARVHQDDDLEPTCRPCLPRRSATARSTRRSRSPGGAGKMAPVGERAAKLDHRPTGTPSTQARGVDQALEPRGRALSDGSRRRRDLSEAAPAQAAIDVCPMTVPRPRAG